MLGWNHAAFTCFHCIHYTFGVELLWASRVLSRCRWGHGWYLDEGMDDVCWFMSMYYVRTYFDLVMLVLTSLTVPTYKWFSTPGFLRWNPEGTKMAWEMVWHLLWRWWEYMGIDMLGQPKIWLVRPYTAADFRRQDESDDEGFYNALLVLQYGQESHRLWWRRSHGRGDSRHFAFDCFCRVGLVLEFQ